MFLFCILFLIDKHLRGSKKFSPLVSLASVALLACLSFSISKASQSAGAHASQCAPPDARVEQLPGGLARISVSAPCKKGNYAVMEYGDLISIGALDESGNWTFILDAFQGSGKLKFSFGDQHRLERDLHIKELESLTKIAIVWRDGVDLDLHAFEYAAPKNSNGHKFSGRRSDLMKTQSHVLASSRSRGFMSSSSAGQALGYNVEVYTVLHHPNEKRGVINFAIDFVSRGGRAQGAYCGSNLYSSIKFNVYVLKRGKPVRAYNRLLSAVQCGTKLFGRTRLISNLVPDLEID